MVTSVKVCVKKESLKLLTGGAKEGRWELYIGDTKTTRPHKRSITRIYFVYEFYISCLVVYKSVNILFATLGTNP